MHKNNKAIVSNNIVKNIDAEIMKTGLNIFDKFKSNTNHANTKVITIRNINAVYIYVFN